MENENLLKLINDTGKTMSNWKYPIMHSLYSLEDHNIEFLHQLYFEGVDTKNLCKKFDFDSSEQAETFLNQSLKELAELIQKENGVLLQQKQLRFILKYYGVEFRKKRRDALNTFFEKPPETEKSVVEFQFEMDQEYRHQLAEADERNVNYILLVSLLMAMYKKGVSVRSPAVRRSIQKETEDNNEQNIANKFINIVVSALDEAKENLPIYVTLPGGLQCSILYNSEIETIEIFDIKKTKTENTGTLTIIFVKTDEQEKQYEQMDGKIALPKQELIDLIKEGYNPIFRLS